MAALHIRYAQALFEITRGKSEAQQRVSVQRLVALLTKRNELTLAALIEKHVNVLLNQERKHATIRVVSAASLDQRERKALKGAFAGARHTFEHNPKLLGGMVVQDGDILYHSSLRNALSELRRAFSG